MEGSDHSKCFCLQERDTEALVRRFKTDLHNCVAYIQEPRLLKEKVRGLFEMYVQRADMVSLTFLPSVPPCRGSPLSHRNTTLPLPQVEIAGLNADLQQEYARQREHLERNLATLRKKVIKENDLHRTDYVRIMQVSGTTQGSRAHGLLAVSARPAASKGPTLFPKAFLHAAPRIPPFLVLPHLDAVTPGLTPSSH